MGNRFASLGPDESEKIHKFIASIRVIPTRRDGNVLRGDVATEHGIVVFVSDCRTGNEFTLMKFAYSGQLYRRKYGVGLSQVQIPKAARAFAGAVVGGEVK